MIELFGYFLAFLVGMIMGLVGAGGSILSSALMIYVFGFNPVISASYTLVNVGVIALVGSLQYYRNKLVNIEAGILFAVPAIITVSLMRRIVMPSIPDMLVRFDFFVFSKQLCVTLVFALLMIWIACNMLLKNNRAVKQAKMVRNRHLAIVLTGMLVGILTGFVGVGGGFIVVPALFFFTSLDMKSSIGTSLFIITLNTSVGFLSDLSVGVVYNWNFLFKFTSVTVAGMIVSGFIVHRVRTDRLKQLFATTMFILGCFIIVKEFAVGRKLVDKHNSEVPCRELETLRTSSTLEG